MTLISSWKCFTFSDYVEKYTLLNKPNERVPPLKEDDEAIAFMKLLAEECRQAELKLTANTIDKIVRLNCSDDSTYGEGQKLIDELYGRLREELNEMNYFALTSDEAKRYKKYRDKWEKIIDRWPAIITDLEEANKCFALSRYTAAVYHSLQIVEAGLVELNRFMNTPNPKRGWDAATNDLKRILETSFDKRTDYEQKHSKFFEQIYATIAILKEAWRNKISHWSEKGHLVLEDSEFTAEIADDILDATRIFMGRLAADLPLSDV